jgi:hypothetical protein
MAKKMTDEEKVLVVARRMVETAKKLRAEIAAHPEVYSKEIVEGLPGEPSMMEVVEGLVEVFEHWPDKFDIEAAASRLRRLEERRRRKGKA